jgi:hypothetical protein
VNDVDLFESAAEDEQGAPADAERKALAAFLKFHAEHPDIYRLLADNARAYRRQTGHEKVGIALLWERLRWVLTVDVQGGDPKLCNTHRAYYARLLMAREPDLRGVFDVRKADADNDWTWVEEAA